MHTITKSSSMTSHQWPLEKLECHSNSVPQINKYDYHCDNDVTLGGHASYGRRHVVSSAVSLSDVYAYASLAKTALTGAYKRCSLPRAGKAGFLPISAGKQLWDNNVDTFVTIQPSIVVIVVNLTGIVLYNYFIVTDVATFRANIYTPSVPFLQSSLPLAAETFWTSDVYTQLNSTLYTRIFSDYDNIQLHFDGIVDTYVLSILDIRSHI